MKKLFKVLTAASLCAGLTACSSAATSGSSAAAAGSDTLTGTYTYHIAGKDYGCGTDKAYVTLDNVVDAVSADMFAVTETKKTTDWTDPNYAETEQSFTRTVTDAYLVDDNGEKTEEPSKNVVIEMNIDPNEGSPLTYGMLTGYNSYCDPYQLEIVLADGAALTSGGTAVTSWTVDTTADKAAVTTDADEFTKETKTYGDYDYNCAYYEVEGSTTLFVWLHGAGEGGSADLGDKTDVNITLLANKVTALAGDDFQDTLGGCNILVPQCPTYWMDDGSGEISGLRTNIYTDTLIELIDDYVEEKGIEKVVIGGCSNGGYMTMILALECGDKYDAYVPICEALKDEYISDEDIQKLVPLPMYFIYSEDDTTVDPTLYEIPTLERLKAAGAEKNVSTTEHVYDLSDEYAALKGEGDAHYTYTGHWSWIYFDNDETSDQNGQSAFDWIAETLK